MSEQATQETATENEQVQLQLTDLLLAAQVIQLASQRGAVKPEEFTQIGGLYERLVKFLRASGAIQPAGDAAETSAE
jgi:hypothetical protein